MLQQISCADVNWLMWPRIGTVVGSSERMTIERIHCKMNLFIVGPGKNFASRIYYSELVVTIGF
jgi:hypothetical protein